MGPRWQEAEGGISQCSNSKLKIVFGILAWIFRVKEEKISTNIKLLENESQEASKAKRCFFRVMLYQHGTTSDSLLSFDRIFLTAGMFSTSVLLSRSGRQTTAGRVKRWLPALCSKTIISSCVPATCQKWFIGRDSLGRHQESQSLFTSICCFVPKLAGGTVLCWGWTVTLEMYVALLCSSQSGWLPKCALDWCLPALTGLHIGILNV